MIRNLWSPWRMKYLMETPPEGCIFCAYATGGEDVKNLVLLRGRHHYIILNLYPYATAHLMLVSNRHVPTLSQLQSEEMAEAVEMLVKIERAVQAVYRPDGANWGVNLGRCAGAGVEGHVHLHYVPRRLRDTEQPSAADSADLPEPLATTFQRLRSALAAEGAKGRK